MENYLYHHGIKGQRWGVRRYQNKDGSLTPAGKKHRNSTVPEDTSGMSNDELRKKINRMNAENRYYDLTRSSSSKISKGSDTIKESSKTLSDLNQITRLSKKTNKYSNTVDQSLKTASRSADLVKKIDKVSLENKHVKDTKIKLEKMSDKELYSTVERLDLERQYASLSKKEISRGKVHVQDVLSITGDVVSIGASAVLIATGIKKLMNK